MEKMQIVVEGGFGGSGIIRLTDFMLKKEGVGKWNDVVQLVNAILRARVWSVDDKIGIISQVRVFLGDDPWNVAAEYLPGLPAAEFVLYKPEWAEIWYKTFPQEELETNLCTFFNGNDIIRAAALRVLAERERIKEGPLLAPEITKALTETFMVRGKETGNKTMSQLIGNWHKGKEGYLVRVHGNTYSVPEKYR